MFYITSTSDSGIVAKKVWEWNFEATITVEGIDEAIRIPKRFISRMAILERVLHES